jgi:hypothetical protein
MPTYIDPKFVHVEPRSRPPIAALIVLAVIGYACYQAAELLASVIVAIFIATAAVTAASLVTLAVVLRRQRGRTHLDAPQWVIERLGASPVRSSAALPVRPATAIQARSPRAIEAPAVVHYHLHLHAAPATQPAIEEDRHL